MGVGTGVEGGEEGAKTRLRPRSCRALKPRNLILKTILLNLILKIKEAI